MIVKCTECGNTFRIDEAHDDELIACPNCEADYKVNKKDGKITITEFVYEAKDPGEL
jgi:DNA-directed RNA polymerase subunit RPC12/RpoP